MKNLFILLAGILLSYTTFSQEETKEKIQKTFHSISSHDLLDYAAELSSQKYKGRLSGSPEYLKSAEWVAGKFEEWGVKPANKGSYFQYFDNAYTEVYSIGKVIWHGKDGSGINKELIFPEEFYPGSNSASGEITGEMVYAGFGITAPELDWDDYAGVDVSGKIAVMETGLPYTKNDPTLAKWTPYAYHRYKFKNAKEHGAAGLLYVSKIANPNTSYIDGFIYAHIDVPVAELMFSVAGKNYSEHKKSLTAEFKPSSFEMGQSVTISAETKNFPGSKACNVVGMIEGSDPVLKDEVILLGGHLDGQGYLGELYPSALDNASGVVDIMAAAKALAESEVRPKRSVLFVLFGGEECGLFGSEYYVNHPLFPVEKAVCMVNLDMVGNGAGFMVTNGMTYPDLYNYFSEANENWLHRSMRTSELRKNYGRPRSDESHFENAGYKTFSLYTSGSIKPVYYHQPYDDIEALTPEIMEDAAKLL
ncbi:MAG: M28 family peptidase, partial [Prolixibacteraceae bacterium]|nr:M28 family peptidase [Prolixibacteraceae bacterium]